MDELDHILVEQLQTKKRQLKAVKRHLKLMPTDPWLQVGMIHVEKKIQFFESMIHNKELIKKKVKKKKECNPDVLTRSMVYLWYRDAYFVSTYGYRMLLNTAQGYLSLLTKKDKN